MKRFLKRKLVLVNKTEYNVYIYLVLACFGMACMVVAGYFWAEVRVAIAPIVFGFVVEGAKYINFSKIKNPDAEEDLSEEEELNIVKMIPMKSLQNIFEKHVSPNITPSTSNDQIKNPSPSGSSSVISSSEKE